MKINSFLIKNFRSIKNSGWVRLSGDGVTAIVGQNESGKSSVLDALRMAFGIDFEINEEDLRVLGDLPEVCLSIDLDKSDLENLFEGCDDLFIKDAEKIFKKNKSNISLIMELIKSSDGYVRSFKLSDAWVNELDLVYEKHVGNAEGDEDLAGDEGLETDGDVSSEGDSLNNCWVMSADDFARELWEMLPNFILFRDEQSQLPNSIDVADSSLARVDGSVGAKNFFSAAGLEIGDLIHGNEREVATKISRANGLITKKLQEFWSQVLGESRKICLECELKYHSISAGDKVGAPYFVFWISEAQEKLYPSQRSRGTKWYISFFLHLLAQSERKLKPVMLLDEPGSYLHAKAQKDVINLIERLSEGSPVIYSTHSPYLLDHKKLHRIIAVERVDDQADCPTSVKRGLDLASASPFTLAPILSALGVDLSQQDVIRKKDNVILEEVSAYYYFMAFKSLLKIDRDIHFVAATGASNVGMLSDLFIAWGLEFKVLVDDDNHGKRVCRDIKKKYGFEDEWSSNNLLTLVGCDGVEDMFSAKDFGRILGDNRGEGILGKNSDYVKKEGISKPMLAINFYHLVDSGDFTYNDFSKDTIDRFRSVFDRL